MTNAELARRMAWRFKVIQQAAERSPPPFDALHQAVVAIATEILPSAERTQMWNISVGLSIQ